ncbi:MAG: aminoglycoside phosphotransferase family protein [Elusimicrobia bacterium]|nr:aminoglycoside phosphotransferase family protein [Elusimicrobiota bacterium]
MRPEPSFRRLWLAAVLAVQPALCSGQNRDAADDPRAELVRAFVFGQAPPVLPATEPLAPLARRIERIQEGTDGSPEAQVRQAGLIRQLATELSPQRPAMPLEPILERYLGRVRAPRPGDSAAAAEAPEPPLVDAAAVTERAKALAAVLSPRVGGEALRFVAGGGSASPGSPQPRAGLFEAMPSPRAALAPPVPGGPGLEIESPWLPSVHEYFAELNGRRRYRIEEVGDQMRASCAGGIGAGCVALAAVFAAGHVVQGTYSIPQDLSGTKPVESALKLTPAALYWDAPELARAASQMHEQGYTWDTVGRTSLSAGATALDVLTLGMAGSAIKTAVAQTSRQAGGSAGRTGAAAAGRVYSPKAVLKNLCVAEDAVADLMRARIAAEPAGAPAERFIRNLERAPDLPPVDRAAPGGLAARNDAVAAFAQSYLSLKAKPAIAAPKTDPLSGAEVYLIKDGGRPVAVYKVYDRDGARQVLNELGAVSTLDRLALSQSSPVRPLGVFRLGEGQRVGYLMEAAPGRDLYQWLAAVGASSDRQAAFAAAEDKVRSAAQSLGELHSRGRGPPLAPERKRELVDELSDRLEALRRPDAADGRTWTIPHDVYEALKTQTARDGERLMKSDLPGAVTHGDAHPGNFFASPEGRLTMIDVETLVWSLGKEGKGIGSPAEDVGRFLESIRINNQTKGLGLEASETRQLEQAFIERYLQTSGMSAPDVEAAVSFFRTRMQVTALRYAKSPEEFESYLNQVRAVQRLNPRLAASLN